MPAYTTGEIIAPPEGHTGQHTCCVCGEALEPNNTMLVDVTGDTTTLQATLGPDYPPEGIRLYDTICIPCTLNR